MLVDPRVEQLIEEILDSGSSAAEVCRASPDLLPQVHEGWLRLRQIRAQLDELFPLPMSLEDNSITPLVQSADVLPRIAGYDIVEVLGHGGVGVVYKALHLRLNRTVALKMLLAGAYATPAERQRFARESRVVAGLRHSNIVQVYDVGDLDGRPYFTMEFVEGGNLAEMLGGTPRPAHQAATLLATLVEAIRAAHQGGIVHRDLKPSNVLLTADGTPKISDFGLARGLEVGPSLTQSGASVGTPSYMAPEQARGKTREIGPASDLYALGAVLYEMLTGRPPFRAETAAETVHQVITQEPVAPSRLNAKVPRDIETICLKCLRKEPQQRYADAAALAEDLHRFLRGDAIAARPEGWPQRLARRLRRRPLLSAVLAGGTLFALTLIGVGLWLLSEWEATTRAVEADRAAVERAADSDLLEMVRWQQQSSWIEAGAALERARGRLGDRGSTALRRRLEQGRRELALVTRLDAIRFEATASFGGVIDFARLVGPYQAAFEEAGLGKLEEGPEVVARRIKASNIKIPLVAMLDDWASHTGDSRRQGWVLDVARLADVDSAGWRAQARNPEIWANKTRLTEILAAAPVAEQSVPLFLTLANRSKAIGGDVIPFLMRVQQAHVGDFWANLSLADAFLDKGESVQSIRYYQAALAIRPMTSIVYHHLGEALMRIGRIEEAADQFRQEAKIDPTAGVAYFMLAQCYQAWGQPAEAIELFRRAVALEPKRTIGQDHLRRLLIQLGKLGDAQAAWARAIEADPPEHDAWDGYAEFCLFLGLEDEYNRSIQRLLERFEADSDPRVAERTGRACLLRPSPTSEVLRAAALIDRALAHEKDHGSTGLLPYYLLAKGLAEYRIGRFDAAISLLQGEASHVLKPAPCLVLAMAQHRRGLVEEAQKTLDEAIGSFDWRPEAANNREAWIFHILRREAEQLISPSHLGFPKERSQP